jgi:hypothetical protein
MGIEKVEVRSADPVANEVLQLLVPSLLVVRGKIAGSMSAPV